MRKFCKRGVFLVEFLEFGFWSLRMGVGSIVVGSAFLWPPDFQLMFPRCFLRSVLRFGVIILGRPNYLKEGLPKML